MLPTKLSAYPTQSQTARLNGAPEICVRHPAKLQILRCAQDDNATNVLGIYSQTPVVQRLGVDIPLRAGYDCADFSQGHLRHLSP
jgi:hypothetical protein